MDYEIDSCRSCDSGNLRDIMSLGSQHVTNFLKDGESPGPSVPLELVLCDGCDLLQLRHNAPNESMWGGQYWYKSAINRMISDDLAEIAGRSMGISNVEGSGNIVVDIGANDGTLLKNYEGRGVRAVGFEPSKNVAADARANGVHIINDYFNAESFREEFGDEKADVITAISMFYDLEDPNSFLGDIGDVLTDNGVFVIQQNYLGTMLSNNAFDNVCHEHREYYSLLSLENLLQRNGLETFDVTQNEINGGSIRTFIRKQGSDIGGNSPGAKERIERVMDDDLGMNLHTPQPYLDFGARIDGIKEKVMGFVEEERKKGKTFGICGASTRGNTILQYFDANPRDFIAAAEANSDKWGRKTVGSNIPIVSIDEMKRINPDYQLVLIWHLYEGLMDKEKDYLTSGGKFVLPLSTPRIIQYSEKEGRQVITDL